MTYGNNISSAAEEHTVVVEGLDVRRGAKRVLPEISLRVRHGTVTACWGRVDQARRRCFGRSWAFRLLREARCPCSECPPVLPSFVSGLRYVTQEASVYADLTVEQNIRYFARVLGAPVSDEPRVIDAVGLQTLEISE